MPKAIGSKTREGTDRFVAEMEHALDQFNRGASSLDARAIRFLNAWKVDLRGLIAGCICESVDLIAEMGKLKEGDAE